MNKKWIIILICTGVMLLLGSLGITFYAVSRMNRVEDLLVFTTETTTTTITTNVPETTITTNVETTITTNAETTTTTIVTEETETLVAETYIETYNNNNDDAMTRGQWYEENGYAGAPEEQETYDHDEFMSMKNSDEGARFSGEYLTTINLSGSIGMGDNKQYMKDGEAIVGVDTGINVGDTIYVVEIGYFTVVELSYSTFTEYDKVVRCYSNEMFYDEGGYRRTVLTTDVYIVG